jgi:hypothetical protein
LGKLCFDLFGVGQSFGDLLASLLEHLQNTAVGKLVKKGANDAKADDLGTQVRPIDAECPGDFLDWSAASRLRK